MEGRSLFYKGSWVEDVGESSRPDPLRIEYQAILRRFRRAILLAYVVGLVAYGVVNVILYVMELANAWRVLFNLGLYTVIFVILAFVVYRLSIRYWLRGHMSGRVLSISEIGSEAVFSHDSDGNITSWSRGAERVVGYSEEEALGGRIDMLMPGRSLQQERETVEGLSREGGVARYETVCVRKGGDRFPAEVSMTVLPGSGDSGSEALVVLRDMTRHAQIEEELKRLNERVQAMAREGASAPGDDGLEEREHARGSATATVRALASVAERRDPYTADHQRCVSELASAIAAELGLTEDQVEGVRVAGILHDTGKVAVPSEILSKPGRLSEFEFGIIKAHPGVDADLVEGIDFPWPVGQAVLQHHERMDGSGYPGGLKGDDIIVEARILAVADVVEAMASHRPYRPARGISEALAEIESGRGVKYDPAVADACKALFDRGFRFT